MKWTLLGCVLWAGCSELRLDLLAPAIDAATPVEDAAQAVEDAALPLDAGPPAMDAGGLILRYDFSGAGTLVSDRVGTGSATVRGGALLNDSGVLELDGVDDYVDLPNRSLAALESATVLSWLTWSGGVCWQRAFDFGYNDAGEGAQGAAFASLFVTFSSCPEGTLLATYEQPPARDVARSNISLAAARPLQLALVVDGAAGRMRLYLDGARVADGSLRFPLSQLADVNAWLGRSQWSQDSFARVRYDEFRLYDRALSDEEVAASFRRGPNAP